MYVPVAYSSPNSTEVVLAPTELPALPLGEAPDGETEEGVGGSIVVT